MLITVAFGAELSHRLFKEVAFVLGGGSGKSQKGFFSEFIISCHPFERVVGMAHSLTGWSSTSLTLCDSLNEGVQIAQVFYSSDAAQSARRRALRDVLSFNELLHQDRRSRGPYYYEPHTNTIQCHDQRLFTPDQVRSEPLSQSDIQVEKERYFQFLQNKAKVIPVASVCIEDSSSFKSPFPMSLSSPKPPAFTQPMFGSSSAPLEAPKPLTPVLNVQNEPALKPRRVELDSESSSEDESPPRKKQKSPLTPPKEPEDASKKANSSPERSAKS